MRHRMWSGVRAVDRRVSSLCAHDETRCGVPSMSPVTHLVCRYRRSYRFEVAHNCWRVLIPAGSCRYPVRARYHLVGPPGARRVRRDLAGLRARRSHLPTGCGSPRPMLTDRPRYPHNVMILYSPYRQHVTDSTEL